MANYLSRQSGDLPLIGEKGVYVCELAHLGKDLLSGQDFILRGINVGDLCVFECLFSPRHNVLHKVDRDVVVGWQILMAINS